MHVNFGNNLRETKAKKVTFYFVTLKWHRLTCYFNWAILIGDPVDVTTLLLGANKSAHWNGWEIENPLELYCIVFHVSVAKYLNLPDFQL